jgi:hypothetical protein
MAHSCSVGFSLRRKLLGAVRVQKEKTKERVGLRTAGTFVMRADRALPTFLKLM